MGLLCFNSKKMMLVDEKGKPFAFEASLPATSEADYNRMVRFTLPLLRKQTFNSSSYTFQKISFDITSSSAHPLYLILGSESAVNKGVKVADLSIGENHITVNLSTLSGPYFVFVIDALAISATQAETFTIKNVVYQV